jgi:hypothetical protein
VKADTYSLLALTTFAFTGILTQQFGGHIPSAAFHMR